MTRTSPEPAGYASETVSHRSLYPLAMLLVLGIMLVQDGLMLTVSRVQQYHAMGARARWAVALCALGWNLASLLLLARPAIVRAIRPVHTPARFAIVGRVGILITLAGLLVSLPGVLSGAVGADEWALAQANFGAAGIVAFGLCVRAGRASKRGSGEGSPTG